MASTHQSPRGAALFVMNFGPRTGYAWGTIQQVFQGVGRRMVEDGLRPLACFPPPFNPSESPFEPPFETLEFDYRRTHGLAGLRAFCRLLREHQVRILYLTDHPTVSWRFPWYRLAGVRRIVIHDRTSGERRPSSPFLQPFKVLLHRARAVSGDLFVGVSDFVVGRLTKVNRTPADRTVRVYNGIPLERFQGDAGNALQDALGLPDGTPVVFASGRANAYKGIPTLLEAWREVEAAGYPTVHAAYAGDGPALEDFKAQARALGLGRFHFLGRRDDVPALLRSASVAVVPSVWEEAFGLTVAEGMAAGKPVIASAVGGIPELVEPGRTGMLVPPAKPAALAAAIRGCLDHPEAAAEMGRRGRVAAGEKFDITRVVEELSGLLARLYPARGPAS